MTKRVEELVLATRPIRFVREILPGETWAVCPDGGYLIVHPDRPPLWCRIDEYGNYRQTIIEPAP